jgi:hypothetical protein
VTRWRAGGADAATGEAAVVASLAAAVAAWAGGVFATALRTIGRALGSGTLDLACPSVAHAGMPAASARLTARAVDKAADKAANRNAVARAKVVTAVLCGESLDRLGSSP